MLKIIRQRNKHGYINSRVVDDQSPDALERMIAGCGVDKHSGEKSAQRSERHGEHGTSEKSLPLCGRKLIGPEWARSG